MATRYYYFLSGPLPVGQIAAQMAPGAAFAVVAPTRTEASFLVVSIDDTAPNEADLLAAMEQLGYVLSSSTLVVPAAFATGRDYGRLAAAPTVPTPALGDLFFDTTMGIQRTRTASSWWPEFPPAVYEADLGTEWLTSGSFDITGFSGLTVNQTIAIQQAPGPYTGKADADEFELSPLTVTAYAANDTTIRCYWSSNDGPVSGNFKFTYKAY